MSLRARVVKAPGAGLEEVVVLRAEEQPGLLPRSSHL